ncbi:MAG: glycoside hydrolase family 38 C-terminal domain-containing protein [Anaerolineales bacterium]
MTHLHLIPHTHWDREWYLPFQEFRLKLIHLVDQLLAILHDQPEFTAFMLDGQTIVLEDYLEVRPERIAEIKRLVQEGRLIVGPWYVLPDEFLVSPESLIRNLLVGREICTRFGACMPVGYLPDPFGHIGQMPQLLQGFGIRFASLRRGLGDAFVELVWKAPDGSSVLVSYLRDGYDNAARAPVLPEAFKDFILRLRDSLAPYAASSHLLLLNGTDHHEAQPEIPSLIEQYDVTDDQLSISTLETYFESVEQEIQQGAIELPVISGDLRDSSRHHLLPGVLSSRTWIKQRNHACETLLERWAEPFSALAQLLLGDPDPVTRWTGHLATPRLSGTEEVLKTAWRMLLACHPHDSICGCSVDQVHREMSPRFDQVAQIASEVTRQSLQDLADAVDTRELARQKARGALVIFNPCEFERSDWVEAIFELSAGLDPFELLDLDGSSIPYRITSRSGRSLTDMELDADGLRAMLGFVQGGEVMGLTVQDVALIEETEMITVDVTVAEEIPANLEAVERGMQEVLAALDSFPDHRYRLIARFATQVEIEFCAPQVPGLGYRALALVPSSNAENQRANSQGNTIENDRFKVTIEEDGTITLTDKTSQRQFANLLQFYDVGERGDSYTHSPVGVSDERLRPVHMSQPHVQSLPGGEVIEYELKFQIPESLMPDREGRRETTVELPVQVKAQLIDGVPRVDIELTVINAARDHRLQVIFPSGIACENALYGGSFDLVGRPTSLPPFNQEWIEDPVVEQPMRNFILTTRNDGGLLIASRGLREASVTAGGEIAVTLLRCFGWLSRDDLPNRKGGAGPQLKTPQGQELGEHDFSLSLVPFDGDPVKAIQQAHAFQTVLLGLGTGIHPGKLPLQSALVRPDSSYFHVTACKSTTAGRLLVRGVNLSHKDLDLNLELSFDIQEAWTANLDEVQQEQLPVKEARAVHLKCRPKEVKTIVLTPGSA